MQSSYPWHKSLLKLLLVTTLLGLIALLEKFPSAALCLQPADVYDRKQVRLHQLIVILGPDDIVP